jgi:hypothetical protein
MKPCLRPAKRQRKERMRAAVQHTIGITARGRMVAVVVCVVELDLAVGSSCEDSEYRETKERVQV